MFPISFHEVTCIRADSLINMINSKNKKFMVYSIVNGTLANSYKGEIAQIHSRLSKASLLFLLEDRDAFWTIPLSLRLCCETHAAKVEPLDGTVHIVTTNHLAIGNLNGEQHH